MKEGRVQAKGDTEGRALMGWGLLDRRVLLMTEDKDTEMLRSLLAQWPDLNRQVAIWPFHGSSKLPTPEVVTGLVKLMGANLKIVLHPDRDFLMPCEIAELAEPYSKAGHRLWFTQCSDIEAYWADTDVIAAHFSIPKDDAQSLLDEAVAAACAEGKALEERRRKRSETMKKIKAVEKGELQQFGDLEVEAEACKQGLQHKVLGKNLTAAICVCRAGQELRGCQQLWKCCPRRIAPDRNRSRKDPPKAHSLAYQTSARDVECMPARGLGGVCTGLATIALVSRP